MAKSPSNDEACEFCKKVFSRPSSMLAHACEKKRRWLARDEHEYRMAFQVFRKFYDIHFRSMTPRVYLDFMTSTHFTAFVKFAKHLLQIQAINPEAFLEFLLKAQVPMKNWTLGFVYEQYVRELNKRESVENAVERNIILMQKWETDSGLPWNEFFKHVNVNLATTLIISGRLSPWVLYTAETSHQLLDRLSEEQMKMIEKSVEPRFWQRKFKENPQDVSFIKDLLHSASV